MNYRNEINVIALYKTVFSYRFVDSTETRTVNTFEQFFNMFTSVSNNITSLITTICKNHL